MNKPEPSEFAIELCVKVLSSSSFSRVRAMYKVFEVIKDTPTEKQIDLIWELSQILHFKADLVLSDFIRFLDQQDNA